MRALWNNLSDPSLHLLAIALFLVYLAFGSGSWHDERDAASPLAFCKTCQVHYLPGKACDCRFPARIANLAP